MWLCKSGSILFTPSEWGFSFSLCLVLLCLFFQMPEFLLGLHPLGGTFLAGDFILAELPHLSAGAQLQSWNFSFLKVPFNLLCATHLSISCMPDIFPCWRGWLPFFFNFQGFPEPVLLSFESLLMIFRINTFPPCIFASYQKREGKK